MNSDTDDYIAPQRDRATGILLDMGCTLRVAALIKEIPSRLLDNKRTVDIFDVGCTIAYVGLETGRGMLGAAHRKSG